MKYWDLVIATVLVFTGVITPYEVIFMGQISAHHPLFIVNRIVDALFVKDMIMQFFMKVDAKVDGRYGTVLLKDPAMIKRRYLLGWFPIDVISVLPFDILLLTVQSAQKASGIKMLRCMRFMRLIKLLRILRTSRLILRWQGYVSLSFAMQKLVKFVLILCLALKRQRSADMGLSGLFFLPDGLCIEHIIISAGSNRTASMHVARQHYRNVALGTGLTSHIYDFGLADRPD